MHLLELFRTILVVFHGAEYSQARERTPRIVHDVDDLKFGQK
jgi:hypothetical protein